MNDHDIHEEVSQLKSEIYKRIRHSFLTASIDLPVLDDEKLTMLYRMLQESDCPSENMETYIITVMLVQAALDTHDLVTVKQLNDERAKEIRQLTVLAGDYYSGLYYYLLAETGNISLIQRIARSIQEINEHKMYLYKSENQTVEQTFENLRVVESSLLQGVAEYFECPLWCKFFGEYFLLRRLLAERERYKQSETSYVLDAIVNSKRKKGLLLVSRQEKFQQLTHLLDSYIEHAKQGMERLFLESSRFETFVGGRIWEIFFEAGSFKQKLAEEG